jgi:hypothetical protein
MLWADDGVITAERAQQLVAFLDDDSLAFRVLSFHNLRQATKLTLYYRPEDPAIKRAPIVQKWRERVRSMPGPLPEGAPAAALPAAEPLPGIPSPPQ